MAAIVSGALCGSFPWARDAVRNPGKHLANSLVIRYIDKDREIRAPNAAALVQMEEELNRRTAVIRSLLLSDPPRANPGPHTCPFCDVRQLCDDYWRPANSEAGQGTAHGFADFEVEIGRILCGSTFEASCHFCSLSPFPQAVLVHISSTNRKLQELVRPGTRMRLLQHPVPTIDGDESPVLSIGGTTEAFIVD